MLYLLTNNNYVWRRVLLVDSFVLPNAIRLNPQRFISTSQQDLLSLSLRRQNQRSFVRSLNAKGGGGGENGGNNNKEPKKNNNNQSKKKKKKNAYASTIVLPETEFSQRANAVKREPELQAFWKEHKLYEKLIEDESKETFVLHDGPPYANGDLHIGHALNKILKDFINRKQLLKGKRVCYVPGWDCHGLPIELKVLQSIAAKNKKEKKKKKKSEDNDSKDSTANRPLTPIELRQQAAAFARETVTAQSTSFQRYGIHGDFDNPYLTLDPKFEAAQIEVFGEMFKKGYIFRGRKPVYWSPSSRTALAEAELEYPENHISKSIYVGLKVTQASPSLQQYADDDDLRVAIWTTTPWTMPANRAVAVNPDLEYSVVKHSTTGKLVVATGLVEKLGQTLGFGEDDSFAILGSLSGRELADGTLYEHPLLGDVDEMKTLPVVEGGDYITTESGTGLVHTAPGHGQEDYATGLKYGLEPVSPVDDAGRFTPETLLPWLDGKSVLGDGNTAVIQALNESTALLQVFDYNHKYPYDWRTKKPTIVRATAQWFASVEGFRDDALDAIETVQWVPPVGKNRIRSFVVGRGDWCISRQRSWGVPIPVFYNKDDSSDVLLNQDTLEHITKLIGEHGSDCWWSMTEEELLPEGYDSSKWTKGTDTMDVWFDSGSSWNGVVKSRPELTYPADVYLEGSDQHRGWFQSSLLTSVAANGQAPYKTVLTHGFVLDEKGFKMSKSLGNVMSPLHVIEGGNNKKQEPAYGADVLRLWVASVDYSSDVCIGNTILKQTFESYRKLRNTARYLIGNLADFDPSTDLVEYEDLPSLDKYLLGLLSQVWTEVDEDIDTYQFNAATQAMLRFTSADLSNFYLDVSKDRLYISPLDDLLRRRTCQTVLYYVLKGFIHSIAPILPHMAEDIYQNLPYNNNNDKSSIFEQSWPSELANFPAHDVEQWSLVRELRDDVNQLLERARSDKLVGASLEAAAYVYIGDDNKRKLLQPLQGDEDMVYPPVKTNGVDELRTALLLSQVHLVDTEEEVRNNCEEQYVSQDTKSGFTVGVKNATGKKCERCWFFFDEPSDVCQRCQYAIGRWEMRVGKKFVKEEEEEDASATPVV